MKIEEIHSIKLSLNWWICWIIKKGDVFWCPKPHHWVNAKMYTENVRLIWFGEMNEDMYFGCSLLCYEDGHTMTCEHGGYYWRCSLPVALELFPVVHVSCQDCQLRGFRPIGIFFPDDDGALARKCLETDLVGGSAEFIELEWEWRRVLLKFIDHPTLARVNAAGTWRESKRCWTASV